MAKKSMNVSLSLVLIMDNASIYWTNSCVFVSEGGKDQDVKSRRVSLQQLSSFLNDLF